MNITEFLLARIEEDENTAKAATPGPWMMDEDSYHIEGGDGFVCFDLRDDETGLHVARFDPARVLAECAAKRAVIQLHKEATREGYDNAAAYLWDALYALASVHRMHPDYQEEWAA